MSTKIVTALVHAHSKSMSGTRTITIETAKITSIKEELIHGQRVYHTRFTDAPSEYLLEDPREDFILLRETMDVFQAFISTFDRPVQVKELRAAFAAIKYWEGFFSQYSEQDMAKKIKINVLATWETFLSEVEFVEIEVIHRCVT